MGARVTNRRRRSIWPLSSELVRLLRVQVTQRYLAYLCVLVISYGLSINLTEVLLLLPASPRPPSLQLFPRSPSPSPAPPSRQHFAWSHKRDHVTRAVTEEDVA